MSLLRGYRERVRLPFSCVGESLTEQSHADSVDVNKIMERFGRSGILPPPAAEPVYADVTVFQRDLRERMEFAERQLLDLQAAYAAYQERSDAEAAKAAAGQSTAPASQAPAQ